MDLLVISTMKNEFVFYDCEYDGDGGFTYAGFSVLSTENKNGDFSSPRHVSQVDRNPYFASHIKHMWEIKQWTP